MTPDEKREELKRRIQSLCIETANERAVDLTYLSSYYKYADDFEGPIVNEPLLEAEERYFYFPIEDQELLDHGHDQNADFWVPQEVKMDKDKESWDSLSVDLQFFLAIIFAFFAGSDGMVNHNLFENFHREIKLRESLFNYAAQIHIEEIHGLMYSILIKTYIEDDETINNLFHAASKMHIIKRKNGWGKKWIKDDHPFAHRNIAFCIVEGIFFSGSFAVLVLLGKLNVLPGAVHSNDFIRRDEGKHVKTGKLHHKRLRNKLKPEVVYDMIIDAVTIEKEFFETALPNDIPNFNYDIIAQYIEYVADKLLIDLGYASYYGRSECPIPEMVKTALTSKKNFFEKRENAYSKEVGIDDDDEF
jgi:ribonucleotide reductase beta subunit family protein with ferritin-like domain